MSRNKKVAIRVGLLAAAAVLMTAPGIASAGPMLSDYFTGMKAEGKEILPIILLGIGAIGIIFAAWGIISAIQTKKNQQPLSWQLFAIFGGACAVIAPVWILAASGSMTGGAGNASEQFDELGVKY